MQEAINSKKNGDIAFRRKDFSEAIDFYTQVCLSFAIESVTRPSSFS